MERLQNEIASNKSQIAELEKEKKNADQDAAVSYTTQILSLQSDNAKNEYDIKAKTLRSKSWRLPQRTHTSPLLSTEL